MAQIEKFKDLTGSFPTFINGHNHCHVANGVIVTIVAQICARWYPSIKSVRVPIQPFTDSDRNIRNFACMSKFKSLLNTPKTTLTTDEEEQRKQDNQDKQESDQDKQKSSKSSQSSSSLQNNNEEQNQNNQETSKTSKNDDQSLDNIEMAEQINISSKISEITHMPCRPKISVYESNCSKSLTNFHGLGFFFKERFYVLT